MFIEQTNESSELTDVKVSKHYIVGVKIDEGSFLSIENTAREGEVSWERLERGRNTLIQIHWGEGLCDGGLQSRPL